MKHAKAIFLIVAGLCMIATGFAFADSDGTAFKQLQDEAAMQPSVHINISGGVRNDATLRSASPAGASSTIILPKVAYPQAVKEDPPAPPPTMGQKIKKFIVDNRPTIFMGGVGAYIGFALMGTLAGALTGGLFFVGLLLFANL